MKPCALSTAELATQMSRYPTWIQMKCRDKQVGQYCTRMSAHGLSPNLLTVPDSHMSVCKHVISYCIAWHSWSRSQDMGDCNITLVCQYMTFVKIHCTSIIICLGQARSEQ